VLTDMTGDELFDALDLDSDGELSRTELHDAARRLEWHWKHAPLYAVLDFLTVRGPLPRDAFISHVTQMARDPHGPFGEVLRSSPCFSSSSSPHASPPEPGAGEEANGNRSGPRSGSGAFRAVVSLLRRIVGEEIANDYEILVQDLCGAPARVSAGDGALLILDPQRSFTRGTWMRSIGPDGVFEVEPLRLAFDNCARLLGECGHRMEKMFTRCPFPPDSYDWDEGLDEVVDDSQPYFIKPGNSVLWPPTNGFKEWVGDLIDRGKRTLVMGGCTLNSCLRVSAIDTQRCFENQGLGVAVDLSLSGARRRNYLRSSLHGGMSSVESALREMVAAGVRVIPNVEWR
jgi:hypothetical protein